MLSPASHGSFQRPTLASPPCLSLTCSQRPTASSAASACASACPDTFDAEVQPLLQRYASYVHLLPATADNYFSTPAGLLNLGLEVAFCSLQGTDAHIFSGRSTISARRQLEPRWRLATFIGGLCCELHRVLSHLIVTDEAGGEWPQFRPLGDWLASRSATRYFVRWRPNATESRGLGVFALPLVVPGATLQYLAQTTASSSRTSCPASAGSRSTATTTSSTLWSAFACAGDRPEPAGQRRSLRRASVRLPPRALPGRRDAPAGVRQSQLVPEPEKSRSWLGPDGLFLLWPQAAHDVQALLKPISWPASPRRLRRCSICCWRPESSFGSRTAPRPGSSCRRS